LSFSWAGFQDYANEYWDDSFDLDLGSPSAARFEVGTGATGFRAFQRKFTRGWVCVNPAYNTDGTAHVGTVTFSLTGGTFSGSGYSNVTSVTLAPGEGVLLALDAGSSLSGGAMNFAALKQALSDRGFSFLTTARLGQYINWARAELDDRAQWPYREAFLTGSAPLTVGDLGQVEEVVDLSTNATLTRSSYGDLAEQFSDLSLGGTPIYWYPATPGGTQEIATYPAATGSIGVQYWRITPDLIDDTDIPLAPSRFHKLIVDIAAREAYRDSDDHQNAEQLQVQIERDVERMVESLLLDQIPSRIQITGMADDW
jgi:hypothetical protein